MFSPEAGPSRYGPHIPITLRSVSAGCRSDIHVGPVRERHVKQGCLIDSATEFLTEVAV